MSREQEAIALLRDLLPVAEETCKRWPNDDCFLIPTANARNFLSRASVESEQVKSSSTVGIPPMDDEARLMRFYGVSTLSELVKVQANHIERLQKQLPTPRDGNPIGVARIG